MAGNTRQPPSHCVENNQQRCRKRQTELERWPCLPREADTGPTAAGETADATNLAAVRHHGLVRGGASEERTRWGRRLNHRLYRRQLRLPPVELWPWHQLEQRAIVCWCSQRASETPACTGWLRLDAAIVRSNTDGPALHYNLNRNTELRPRPVVGRKEKQGNGSDRQERRRSQRTRREARQSLCW